MNKIVHGIIRGKTIELTEDPGVADGQQVEVQLKAVEAEAWGEGTSFGRCIERQSGMGPDHGRSPSQHG